MKLESPVLTVREVAEILRVHQVTVYRLIRNGTLSPLRVGRVWRFDRGQVEDLVTREATQGAAAR
jgi:excisionase family DNA binding protein